MSDYDLIVVGGGPAGYVGAIRAAQLGKKVACVERERAGGTCLNWGCIPTKALLKTAQTYTTVTKKASDLGINVGDVSVDWDKVISRSRGVTDRMAGGIEHLFKKNGVEYLRGEGSLGDNGRVTITKEDGEESTVSADKILLATGARARTIPGLEFNGKTVLNARQAMVVDKQPKSIAIIGAGAIGVEFAHFYNAFGTETTIVEMQDRLLPVEDEEVSQALGRSFKKQGVKLQLGKKTVDTEVTDDGVKLTVEPADGGDQQVIEADCVLVAIGVEPVLPEGTDKLDKQERGDWLQVGDEYQTNIPGVYACGDLSGPPWLAHTASFEAVQAVEGMFVDGHQPKQVDVFPGCTYCSPEVASVGKTERALKEEGVAYKSGKFPFMASGRAVASGDADGFVKVLYGEEFGELLGAHIIGPEATELIAEMGLAITMEATYADLEATIHAHPTLSEAIHEATGAAYGHPIHI